MLDNAILLILSSAILGISAVLKDGFPVLKEKKWWSGTLIILICLAAYMNLSEHMEQKEQRLNERKLQEEKTEQLEKRIADMAKIQELVSKQTSFLSHERQWYSLFEPRLSQSVLKNYAKVVFGDNTFGLTNGNEFTIWKVGNRSLISARNDGKELFLNILVFDKHDNIVAKVIENEIFLNLQNIAWKEVYRDRVTIINKNNEVALILKRIAPGTIRIIGTFYYNGKCFLASDDEGTILGPPEEKKWELLPEHDKMKSKGVTFFSQE